MIEQTTLHNILTWVIAVVLFIFQSLNYFIAWIKKYVKHGQKTTTVMKADTTISSESILNNKNVPENVITVQGLIQKHFDIPLIIAEDEPKVYNFIKSAQLLTSNEICKEKTKIDQFMENLVDDSYVARGLGLITATVGRQSEFYLYSKYDNNFENVVIRLNGRNGETGQITILSKNPANIVEPKSIPMDYIYDKDRIKVTYTPFAEGMYTLTLVRNSLSICRSPYYISVEKSPTNSRSQIRLGTKKYKPVTKFTKSKHSLETCDNSVPVIEPSKPSICKNILPESEKNSIRTDVMSIVTKFESNSIHFQKRVHKSTSSISEKGSETDIINEITKYSNIPPKTETNNVHDTYVSDLNSPSIHSKTKSTDKNFWNDVDITYKNSKASDINTIDFESERIMKPMPTLNEHVGITKDIPEAKNVSSTRLQPTNSILVESLKIENLHDVEEHNQTFKTTELMDENKLIEKCLDPTTRIYESENKCIDNEPNITNEVSCFDDEDRKTVVVMDSNEIESNENDTVTQQITDSAQYNINTPFASVITKITNSICEKCSIKVLKIISEFPRDINITHKNNSNEMRSSFETLLAQPISININIDNMFEQPTNEHDSEHLLTINSTKIKHIGTIDKDIQCSYLNKIEPIDSNSDELCGNINNMSEELMIKQNEHNSKIDETIKDEVFDHCIVPFTVRTIDKHNTKNNELSTNEIMKIKYSTTNEDNVLHSNQFNNNTIHKSDNKMEIQIQHLQKSSEHSIGLIKTNQFHENINKELNHISKESDKSLDTSDLVTINNDKNTNCELVTDKFKINNVIIPDENTNIQSSVINNIGLASKEVTLVTTEYKSEDNEEQTNNISYKNVTLTSLQNENQKLMIEKSIEPVLTSFKNKMVEKITQLYLNRDSSNTDNTSTFQTHDKHLTNNLHKIQINNNANSTEINTKCIETPTSQLKYHIDKNEISEIILDQQKTDSNHLLKYVENIIKTKINPSGLYAHTLGEIKLQTLVNTAMNHTNNQQIDNEFKNMIIDNDTQDDKLKKIDNGEIVQDIEAMLVETPSVTIIKNTDELKLPKNEVTVTTQCKIPLINDFDTIEIENTNTDSKQEMQTINVNENDTLVETNVVEIKALQNFQKSHNTKIITPIIELRPTLETRIMNTSELVTVEENSSKEIQTTIEIIDSINIPEETNAVENIDDKNEYESVKLQFKENKIKIPHLVEKEILNEVVENTSTNTSTKSNSTESVSMQAEIESPGLTKVCSANDVTIERDIIYKLLPPAENIVIDKPNSQSIPTFDAQVSINTANVTIGINTSDPQFSNTAITVLIPSKIPLIEDNSFIPKLRIVSTLNKLDAIKILTIPKYSATCDKKITNIELQNTSEPTLSPNKLYMKNRKLEKIENIDETRIPTDTEIETLEYLNKYGKIKSIPSISNDTLAETTVESKTEKNTLHKTLNPKYKVTTLEPTENYINCNNNKNETKIPISSSTGEVVEKPIKKHTAIESTPPIYPQSEPDKKDYEALICAEAETPTVIDTSTASLIRKIVVEFVANKNKTPIEALEIIVHEPIEEDIVIVRETTPTINSLVAVMEEQVNIKTNRSDKYCVRSDDNVTNTGTKTRKSIGQNNAEQIIEKESPSLMNSLGELVQENMNMNINTENETLLPIESTVESIVEPKIEDITEPEITSCTESATEIIDNQFHAEKMVDEVLIDSLGEVTEENTNINIVSESEKLLPLVLTKESILEPTVEEDISVTAITPCTDFSTLTVEVETNVEKVIEEESPSPMNSLGELVQENMNMNINTENKTLLPIESTVESIVEPKIEDITEPEITSCTESATEIIDNQFHAEKRVDEVLIDSLGEVTEENTNINIVSESEKLLSIVLTKESILEPTVEEDISVTAITPCTNFFTLTVEVETNVEKVIEEESPSPMNSLGELVQENMNMNINTENETLLPIESTVESIVEPKIEDITEPEITSCTESATEIIDNQFHAEKRVDEVLIDSLGEVTEENTNINIVSESEKLLPIVLTKESILEPTVEEDISVTAITSRTDFSTLTVDVETNVQKVIEEESPVPMNSLGELVQENMNMNINTENETLLPIESTVESIVEPKIEDITDPEITSCTESAIEIIDIQFHAEKMFDHEAPPVPINISEEEVDGKSKVIVDTETETHLPIVSTIESIEKLNLVERIIATKIPYFTESSTEITDMQMDQDNAIVEPSPTPINFLSEIEEVKTKVHINTESEALLPMTNYIEEKEIIEETSQIVLPIESAMEFIQELKLKEDIIEIKIKSCTDYSTVTIQKDKKNVIEEESSTPINSLGEVVEKNTNDNIDKENEIILPIDSITGSMEEKKEKYGHIDPLLTMKSTMESIKEPKEDADITVNEITSCSNSSSVILEIKMDVEKVIEEVSMAPINCSDEEVGEKSNVNNHTENKTLLPIAFTIETIAIPKTVGDITETEISSCMESSDSCTLTVDAQTDEEKGLDEVTPVLFNSSGKIIGEERKVTLDSEYETILPVKASYESIGEPKVVEDITETEIKSCTVPSTENMMHVQTNNEKYLAEKCPTAFNSSVGEVGEKSKANIDTEDETLLPIVSTKESIEETKIEPTVATVTEILSCTESSSIKINYQNHTDKIVDEVPINYLSEVMGENINVNIVTENKTHLPIGSTVKAVQVPNVVEDITEIEKRSSTIILDTKMYVEKVIEEIPSVLIDPSDKLVGENPKVYMDTEYETILPIELAIETEILTCTDSSTGKVVAQTDEEKVIGEVSLTLINSSDKVMGGNTNVNIDDENETLRPIDTYTGYVKDKKDILKLIETLLPIESTVESIDEPKVKDITEPEITSCTESSTEMIDNQNHAEKIVDQKHPVLINSSDKLVGGNTNVNIDTETETLSPIGSTMESIEVSKEVEDIKETEKIPSTNSFIVTIDIHTDVEKIIDKESPSIINSFGELVQENMNMNINTENETLLPIELTVESIEESNIVDDRTEIEITSYTEPLTKITNPQFHAEKIVDKVKINSLGEVMGENTKMKIVTESETLLSIGSTEESMVEPKVDEDITVTTKTSCADSSTLTVDVQTDVDKVIEEESLSQMESLKQINVIINSKTETLFPIGTNTTFVDEPNVLGHVSENEHAALLDSSITIIKQQIKVDTETEIETLLLIDNLTESIKEQIVEKITENKTSTLIDSLAEMVGEESKVNVDTDNQTLLTINTSSTNVDDQIKNGIKNETQTPIYSVVNVAEEQTKVNIEINNKTITPIDIFTTSIEEQLNVEYLCENENTIHIDSVPKMIKNQTKIDIKTENENLLSIENTSFEEQMDEMHKIIQNNLLVDFSAAAELKGYEILTDMETETSTSIDTLNTTVDRQKVKENFKEIESRIRIVTSTAFEEEQKSEEHITIKENVLSIGTSTASVEEEIQVEEVIENESASLKSYSTIHDVASLEEPKVIKNETPTPIDILVTAAEKQTDLEKVAENEIPILVNTSTKSVEKQIKTEKGTENETITLIACEALPKIETNKFEAESENETSTPVNNSASIRIKQTEAEDVTETTLRNDDTIYRNTKTNLIGIENKTENSDNPNNCYLKFGESSKMHRLDNEDNLQRKSYGIQKLEMSIQRMKTSDADYYEKTFVQLEQTENISKVDKVNVDDENKTIIDDKLYTVNESDLNAILCASSLEEALTLLDSKIKFKFKHKKSSSKINSVEYIPKIQTSDSNSSGVNTNFTDARKFFKEIEKKSKK